MVLRGSISFTKAWRATKATGGGLAIKTGDKSEILTLS